ncbi:MAG: PD-(D/E)XK nuclease family protein [Rickettsiaceae bacterium]|nr:PD-(D/E)XK nuclease family protein [Rickettsiaceae bacterium]
MNFFDYSGSKTKTPYLDLVAQKFLELRGQKPEMEFWIVTPNYFSIEILKSKLLNANQNNSRAMILPRITTAENYILSSVINEESNIYSNYEQTIIMSEIIFQYENINYRISEALEIASEFVLIFWKLKKNFVNIEEVDKWVEEDVAQHWWHMSYFLKFCFTKFEDVISTPKNKNIKTLDSIDHKNRFIILVGQLENIDFFANYFEANQIHHLVILPPLNHEFVLEQNPGMRYFLKYYSNQEDIIKKISQGDIADNQNILSAQNLQYSESEGEIVKLYEFYDIYEEIEFIGNFAVTKARQNETILIITSSQFVDNFLSSSFESYGENFCSSFGSKYTSLAEASLFQSLARFKTENGSIESIIALLSSSILHQNNEVQTLLNELNTAPIFFENFAAIYSFHKGKSDSLDASINLMLDELASLLENQEDNLKSLLVLIYSSFKTLYKTLNLKSKYKEAERFRVFIEDIISISNPIPVSLEEFLTYAQNIFNLKSSMPFEKSARIYILKYDDALLIDSNWVIFADFNQDTILKPTNDNDWLTQKIFQKIIPGYKEDSFYKILYQVTSKIFSCSNTKSNILFSRSIFKDGVCCEKCSILDFIDHKEVRITIQTEGHETRQQKPPLAHRDSFPNKLYATNVELLLRNPYGFFAKKILGLSKRKNLLTKVETSDFGSIIHEIIEIYTTQNTEFHDLYHKILQERGIPQFYRNLWLKSVENIIGEISDINYKTKSLEGLIFVEIEGSCEIKIGSINTNQNSQSIELSAIADRIEVYDNKIRIIDFKTGAPPSKKDVFSGKSPQLMVEAIIYSSGGFKEIPYNPKAEIELVYIKINTRSPYLEEDIIKVTKEMIIEHKEALVMLLEFYYGKEGLVEFNNSFIIDQLVPKFDDYKYLRRE